MVRTKKQTRFWLCRNGHPMFRDEGQRNWRCVECSYINSNSKLHSLKLRVCINGHLGLVGTECRICNRWRDTPWLRQLDETGEGVCPYGHKVTHHDESLMYVVGPAGQRSRSCRVCRLTFAEKGRALIPAWETQEFCRNGLHRKIPENYQQNKNGTQTCRPCYEQRCLEFRERRALQNEARRGLPANHVDWVVVERLLNPERPIGYLRRGQHIGPTDGERWVAYCTWQENNPNRNPEDGAMLIDGYPGFLYRLAEWKKLGRDKRGKRRFKTVTLSEIRQMIHTEEYARNQVLNIAPPRRRAA